MKPSFFIHLAGTAALAMPQRDLEGDKKRDLKYIQVDGPWDTMGKIVPSEPNGWPRDEKRQSINDQLNNMPIVVSTGKDPCEAYLNLSMCVNGKWPSGWTRSAREKRQYLWNDPWATMGRVVPSGDLPSWKRDQFNNMPKVVSNGEDPCKYYPDMSFCVDGKMPGWKEIGKFSS